MDSNHDGFGDGLEDPVLAELLTELRSIADEPAPAIGPDLAAVMGGAVPLNTSRTRSRAASAIVLGLMSTGILTGGISAAAADQLPAPVQRVVARVVNSMTPFEIPDRAVRIPTERTPDEEAPAQPGPTERDEDTPPPDEATAPSPEESEPEPESPDSGDEGDEGSDESDHQSGDEDGDRGSNTSDSAEEGDRSLDDGTRDEDEDADRDADQRDLDADDSDDSQSDAPDEPSGGDDSGGSDGSGGGGDDSDDDGVEPIDVEDD